jgi:hypothetical protein
MTVSKGAKKTADFEFGTQGLRNENPNERSVLEFVSSELIFSFASFATSRDIHSAFTRSKPLVSVAACLRSQIS